MFAKIFGQIFDSSIADDPALRHFFMDMLVLADSEGVVDMTPRSIAAKTGLSRSDVDVWLAKLQEPDIESRTPNECGKRIVPLDSHRSWGWRIVNFKKYRQSATKEMLRMAEADRKAEYRRRKGFPTPLPKVTSIQKTDTEADQSMDMSQRVPDMSRTFDMPDKREAIAQTAVSGVDPKFAAYVFDDWSCREGKDASGNRCKWLPYVTKRWNRERKAWADGNHNGNQSNGSTDPNI